VVEKIACLLSDVVCFVVQRQEMLALPLCRTAACT
jgi:hypothetical protein